MKTMELKHGREMLCRRLQAQRLLLAIKIDVDPPVMMRRTYRSMTMRLLGKDRKLPVLLLMEIMPLLIVQVVQVLRKRRKQ